MHVYAADTPQYRIESDVSIPGSETREGVEGRTMEGEEGRTKEEEGRMFMEDSLLWRRCKKTEYVIQRLGN